MFPRPPDLAIVAEPTDLNVVVAHQGMVRWRCHTTGRAAHSSRPAEGINAIYAMGRVAAAIEKYQQQLADREPHPLCGRPAVCVTTIQGGVGINTVPDRVTISIDRRIGPGESPEAAYADVVDYVAEHAELGDARLDARSAVHEEQRTLRREQSAARRAARAAGARHRAATASWSALPTAPTRPRSARPACRRSSSAPARSPRRTRPTSSST